MKLKTLIKCLIKKNEMDLRLNPDNPTVLLNTGIIIELLGNFDEAMKTYRKVVSIDSSMKEAYYRMGLINYKTNMLYEALSNMDQAIELDGYYLDAHYYKGLICVVLSKHTEAIEHFDKVISLDPFHKQAWNDKGIALIMIGRPAEAIQCFDFLISIDPEDGNAYYQKGIALEDLGRTNEANKCFIKADMYPEEEDTEEGSSKDDDYNGKELADIENATDLEKFLHANPQIKI